MSGGVYSTVLALAAKDIDFGHHFVEGVVQGKVSAYTPHRGRFVASAGDGAVKRLPICPLGRVVSIAPVRGGVMYSSGTTVEQ